MIKSEEVSIIAQGPVSKDTDECIVSLRNVFPKAQLILATTDADKLNCTVLCDNLVIVEDVGGVVVNSCNDLNNVNRLLNGVKKALTVADRKYILKTRTDVAFYDDSFLDYYAVHNEGILAPQKNRLVTINFYTRNPRIFPITYSPSDWILFGDREDVIRYYSNTKLMSQEDQVYLKERGISTFGNMIPRWMSEQYIFTSYLESINHNVCSRHTADNNVTAIIDTEEMFAKCFVVLDYGKQINVKFLKRNPCVEKFSLYGYKTWKVLYDYYCKKRNLSSRIKYYAYSFFSDLMGKAISLRRKLKALSY